LKYTPTIKTWISRSILAAGLVWVVVIFSREYAGLRDSFVVQSLSWLAFTVAAGCLALLATVPAFRNLLATYSRQSIAVAQAARMLFVAQILRHIPGRIWGVMYLVNETHTRIPAASMVRANIDFVMYSMSMNVLVAASLYVAVTQSTIAATLLVIAGFAVLTFALRHDWIGYLTGFIARIMPSRAKTFTDAVAAQGRLSWRTAIGIAAAFALAWCCFLSIWWALPRVFAVLEGVDIWLLCAAYSLAWVVGYLAMITPGGLGVREAGFFALASPLMDLPELTFLAVFIRLWQIVVESLMFVSFAFFKPRPETSNDGSTSSA
jgi:uncharacterized membrane protein YbhN (UPF0104 family)